MPNIDNARIILRNDTQANWQSTSPLAQGEIGLLIDNDNFDLRIGKFGDGTWSNAIRPLKDIATNKEAIEELTNDLGTLSTSVETLGQTSSTLVSKVNAMEPVVNTINNIQIPKLQASIVSDEEKYKIFMSTSQAKDFIYSTTAQVFRLWDFVNKLLTSIYNSESFETFKNELPEMFNFSVASKMIDTYQSDIQFGLPELVESEPDNMNSIIDSSQK